MLALLAGFGFLAQIRSRALAHREGTERWRQPACQGAAAKWRERPRG